MNLAIIFGGQSTEHDISITSGMNILKYIKKDKYNIYPIYIAKNGNWYEWKKDKYLIPISNIISYLKNMDVVFPILHGKNGEDGTIQGLLSLINVPYVGCKVLSSSICMDKIYTKRILREANILCVDDIYLKKENNNIYYMQKNCIYKEVDYEKIDKLINKKFKYPVFIKPSNGGSSIGVNIAYKKEDLALFVDKAFLYDNKILIEKAIIGQEVECAILDDLVSDIGEVITDDNFYSYNAKYKNKKSLTVIPADISNDIKRKIKKIAYRAFRAVDGNSLSRIDFFIEKDTNKIYLNEINTMPGFTDISMYPKLIENVNINYSDLLDRLITLASINN